MPRATLRPSEQRAWELHQGEPDLSDEALGKRLRIKPSAVRVYLSRARSHYSRIAREGAAGAELLGPERLTQREIAARHDLREKEVRAINAELKNPANGAKREVLRDLSDRHYHEQVKTIRTLYAAEIIDRATTEGGLANERVQNLAVVMGISDDKERIMAGKPSATIQVDIRHHIDDLIEEAIKVSQQRGEDIVIDPVSNAVTVSPPIDASPVRRAKAIGDSFEDAELP